MSARLPAGAPTGRPGRVRVATEVVASIAALAVLDCQGVAAMCAPQGASVDRLLRRQHGHKGVRVTMLDSTTLRLDLHLAMRASASLPELTEEVQRRVSDAVAKMLGLEVAEVNLHVVDVEPG